MTPDQDERQPLVPPTPPVIYGMENRGSGPISIFPALALLSLIYVVILTIIHPHATKSGSRLPFNVELDDVMVVPFLVALFCGIAGIYQCRKRGNHLFNLRLAIISTYIAAGLLLYSILSPLGWFVKD